MRYILFAGTGSLIVQGSGDVVATNPQGRSTRMEQNLVMGFDSRLVVGVNRTEVFWPYLWRKTPLVDDEFTGSHPLFWQKSSGDGPSNPIAKVFDAFFSASARCSASDSWQGGAMATYDVNPDAVAHARRLIDGRQYVLDSDWGEVQPDAEARERLPREAPVRGLRRAGTSA